MSTIPKRLAIGQITTTTLTTIYTAPTGINTRAVKLGLTNTGTTATVISVYHNDGTTDYLQAAVTLPGGAGKERPYFGIQRVMINAGDSLKIQSSVAITFNYSLHGSEVEI